MKIIKILSLLITAYLFHNCGNNPENSNNLFSIKIENAKKTYTSNDSFQVSVTNKQKKEIDSVVYSLNSIRIASSINNNLATISLIDQKLGKRSLMANIYMNGTSNGVTGNFTIVASQSPKLYTYNVLETYPHDIEAYTQGLEFKGDTLYESTGQYKQSSLRKTNYQSGEVIQNIPLSDQYFGEGLTIINDKIYQLTWREKTGFIYDLSTLKRTGTFVYGKSKEGWGLCNDGKTIYKSDGTQKIWLLNSGTLSEDDYIEIYTNTRKIKSVNELEWVNGKIYANIYEKDAVAIVNPSNGAVEGVINLKGLKDQVTQHSKLNVLNGIAYKGEENILYITGKNWDKLFKIEIVEKE